MAGKRQMTFGKRDQNVHVSYNGQVEFRDYTNLAEWSIRSLSSFALTDIGKYIVNNVRQMIRTDYPELPHRRVTHAYQYWVRKIEVDLIVGIKNPYLGRNAKGQTSSGERFYDAWYNMGLETGMQGSVKIPRKAYFETFVYANVDMIRKIEASYLSAIDMDNDQLITYINDGEGLLEVDEDDGEVTDD